MHCRVIGVQRNANHQVGVLKLCVGGREGGVGKSAPVAQHMYRRAREVDFGKPEDFEETFASKCRLAPGEPDFAGAFRYQWNYTLNFIE
jgi:hypothetical protein